MSFGGNSKKFLDFSIVYISLEFLTIDGTSQTSAPEVTFSETVWRTGGSSEECPLCP